ncbi:hypothetical protein ACIQZO_17330 [Streptomyces sp. NPDC097617]|uniref:hypothetical protein n=1 Tax=Streptomyces sp. NPDC097617 TaxID=3366091 RepID=UPI003819AA91
MECPSRHRRDEVRALPAAGGKRFAGEDGGNQAQWPAGSWGGSALPAADGSGAELLFLGWISA